MKQRQIFLRDILAILFKRKLLIVSFAILVFAIVFVGNYVWPPTYESSARLRLTRGREVYQTDPSVMKSQENIAMIQMGQQDVNSEIDVIRSRDVLEQVAKDMGLDQPQPPAKNVLRQVYRTVKKAYLEGLYYLQIKSRPTPIQAAIEKLTDAIVVEPVRDSFLIDVRCRLGEPNMAHDVLAHLLDVYVQKRVAVFSNTKNSPFFQEQMDHASEALKNAQAALDEFRAMNQIVNVEGEKQLLLQQDTELKRLLSQMQETETAAESVGDNVSESALTEILSRQTGSPVVTEMQMRLLELLAERNRLSKTLGPKHPNLIRSNREVAEALNNLKGAIQEVKRTTEAKLAEIGERLANLNSVVSQLENLDREVKIHSASLEYYKQKFEESRVMDAMAQEQISNVKVVSSPTMPVDPIKPKKLFNLVFALIAGIVGGLALAFFLEYLDHGIKTPEDVECYLEVPLLASFFRAPKGRLNPKELERLCTALEFINPESPVKLVQVTSAVGGEGAQSVARALAETHARDSGGQVLLVDFVGGPGQKKAAGGMGMIDVLTDQTVLDDALISDGNLFILERGTQSEIPLYMWNSPRMASFLDELRQRFTFVVFHLGSVLQTAETLRLARSVDGTVIVIRSDSTRREVVGRAIDMLREAKGKVFGAVLTERKQQIPQAIYRRI
ncbi:MAG TPA: polysaccharide biosynthesis tyrosine autokinase [Candidatus Hydrogenedentes bacterium]|nr:polysaccharide biosynthesis tyrosine autokinase [Candidatus Hydrogenedentota bacterium]HOV73626.1 polysaccharide biosynthesis tyrosine autokinase [Candidatus Hydrogenedentota bacterium]HPC16330.1 polysaccharide biosynthesis tyrosine autokinase [Candidatus Hydrogenedentota bacterium]HRT20752.1 polysaccharide biosynthesis tyrosine autokinase [Candidatus Hydrogenedentota bacterium]HRT66754.1 polysaccharide biosynthesis tyrosine autokinase [Candidatus Hydrogenedentota bacterium]